MRMLIVVEEFRGKGKKDLLEVWEVFLGLYYLE